MSLGFNPFLSLARGTVWTPARIERELSRLGRPGFFSPEGHSGHQGSLQVLGRIGFTLQATGRVEAMDVRLEYPKEYPWEVPSVFDEKKLFQPSAAGHQFPNHKLCLSFPGREEFTLGSEDLAFEVMGASLIWLDKRFIFERTKIWPGEAEEHGWARPFRKLLIEEANRSKNDCVKAWTDWIIAGLAVPRYDTGCPCCSGGMFCRCHQRLAMLTCQFVFWRQQEQELNDQRSTLQAA
jgi:hypothetical protein